MSFRRSMLPRLATALVALLCLLTLASPVFAQGDEGTPTDASGTLLVTAAACMEGGEPGSVLFALDAGIAAGASCTPADIAISMDGGDALGVSGSGVFALAVGSHTVTDLETGQNLTVEIAADTQTAIERVAFVAAPTAIPTDTPVPTETATPTPVGTPAPGQITITMHLCPPTIVNKDGFTALGGFEQQMAACPSILLPGNQPVVGTVGGGEASFDLQMTSGSGDTTENQTLANSVFTPGSRCETDAGFDLDNDGQLATCFDLSGYAISYAAPGPVVITLGPLPPDTRLGAAGFIPNSGDEQTLRRTTKEGIIELDTTGDDDVHLNVFLFQQTADANPGACNGDGDVNGKSNADADLATNCEADANRNPHANRDGHPDAGAGANCVAVADAISDPQPGGTGTLQAIALYCTADIDAARLTALPPGREAGGADLGDSTCIGGNATFDLYKAGAFVASVSTGVPGVTFLSDLAAGNYSVIDRKSGASADATIEQGVITRSILLSFAATVGDAGSGGLVIDDGTGGDNGGPTIGVSGGLVNDGGLGGDSGDGADGAGRAAALADDDSADTESVNALVPVGTGPPGNADDVALPLAGGLLILLLAGLRLTRRHS